MPCGCLADKLAALLSAACTRCDAIGLLDHHGHLPCTFVVNRLRAFSVSNSLRQGSCLNHAAALPLQESQPGLEADMNAKPIFIRDSYKGSDKLKGKVAIITGGST